MEYRSLRLQNEAPCARITLSRASNGNRVSARLLDELRAACEAVADAEDIRAVVLTAEGDDFCLGWEEDTFAEGFELGPDPFGCLAALPQPSVCAVQGVAASAGIEIALACDVRICREDARFSLPETEQGMLPRGGGTQRLARAVGRGRALAMILAGEEMDAQAALGAGLVSHVFPKERLTAEAEALARTIAGRGPIAIRYAKEAIHRGLDMTLDQALRYETDLTIILQTTEDKAEGVRAFIEGRRRPDFKGK